MARDIITVTQKGDFKKTEKFLKRMKNRSYLSDLAQYGEMGVSALRAATPKDTGITADSWDYSIEQGDGFVRLAWNNSNVQDGVNIALILNTGHGTRQGYWIEGRNYIDPALLPVFDKIADGAWKGVVE